MLTVTALVVAGASSWRRRRRDLLGLAITAALAFLGCALTAGRIEGEVEDWLVVWMSAPGLAVWVLCAWMALEWAGRTPSLVAATTVVTGAAVAALAIYNSAGALDATAWRTGASDTVASLERRLRPQLGSEERPAVMTFGPGASDVSPMGWGAGLVLALEKHDVDLRVDPRWRLQFGERRTEVTRRATRLLVTTDERCVPTRTQDLAAEADGVLVYHS